MGMFDGIRDIIGEMKTGPMNWQYPTEIPSIQRANMEFREHAMRLEKEIDGCDKRVDAMAEMLCVLLEDLAVDPDPNGATYFNEKTRLLRIGQIKKALDMPAGKQTKVMYTSYFGDMARLRNGYVPIAICGRVPDALSTIRHYKKLAPTWSIWKEWHESIDADKDKMYAERFKNEVLARLDPEKVVSDLIEKANGGIPVLLCYEKPGEFCHRHLVAEWINNSGAAKVSEYGEED